MAGRVALNVASVAPEPHAGKNTVSLRKKARLPSEKKKQFPSEKKKKHCLPQRKKPVSRRKKAWLPSEKNTPQFPSKKRTVSLRAGSRRHQCPHPSSREVSRHGRKKKIKPEGPVFSHLQVTWEGVTTNRGDKDCGDEKKRREKKQRRCSFCCSLRGEQPDPRPKGTCGLLSACNLRARGLQK